jgi:hypothetical protein
MLRLVSTAFAGVSLVVLALHASPSTSADSQLAGTQGIRQCNALPADFPEGLAGDPACTDALTPNTPHNLTAHTSIDGGSSALDRLVGFAPNGYTVATGAAIPDGEKVGGVRYFTAIGLANGPCNIPTTVDVALYDVALPDNPASPRASTNIAFPRNQGEPDRFGAWQVGAPPPDGGPSAGIVDSGADGRADATSLPIMNYPAHLLDYFDPDGAGAANPLVPSAVYGGLTSLQGEWLPIYVALFPAGGLASLPGAWSQMNALMGQPFVHVVGDSTASVSSPSMITDTCTPMSVTTMLLGQVDAVVRSRTPAAGGTYFWLQHSTTRRDADQDGIDNHADTCPAHPNAGIDGDGDGIDDVCDLLPATGGTDADGDEFLNREDNCPQVANGGAQQIDSEVTALASNDGGPSGDGIGDACDTGSLPSPGSVCPAPDTGPPGKDYVCQNNRPLSLTLSASVANGRYHLRTDVSAKCIGGTDADGDGYCAPQDTVDAPTPACPLACAMVRHRAWNPQHPAQQMDTDADKFSDALETYLRTDAAKSCAWDDTTSNETFDNWPLDFSDNAFANKTDISFAFGFPQAFAKYVGSDAFARTRYDLNHDGFISSLDMTRYVPIGDFDTQGRLCSQVGVPLWSQQ